MSGQQAGAKHGAGVERFLISYESLPYSSDGTVNVTGLVRQTGVSKQSLHRKANIKSKLQAARRATAPKYVGRRPDRVSEVRCMHIHNITSAR